MRFIIFRLTSAVLTFIIGITSVTICASFDRLVREEARTPSSVLSLPELKLTSSEQNTQEETLAYEQGLYTNYNYAYRVIIPEGLIGYRSPAPMPQHGFGIDLSKEEDARIWVDASYNALFWESFTDAINDNLDFLKDRDITDVKLVQRTPTSLSGLRAVRFVAHYKQSGIRMVEEVILAFRKENEEAEIVYSINLRTPFSRYAKDRKVMNELEKSFKLEPLPYQ